MIYDHWCTDLLLQLRGLQLNRKQLFNAAHWNFSEPGSSHAAYAIKIYWMKSETNGHTGHKNNPTQSKASLHSIYIFIFIWVNYNSSLTWIKAIWGWFPLLTMIIVRSQWGRYNLPRFIIIIRYTYINKYIYMYINIYIYPFLFWSRSLGRTGWSLSTSVEARARRRCVEHWDSRHGMTPRIQPQVEILQILWMQGRDCTNNDIIISNNSNYAINVNI